MTSFSIQFDKVDKKYKPGDTIHCNVHITVTEKFQARSLSVQFLGVVHTEWTQVGRIRRKKIHTFTGDEIFFDHRHYMTGKKNGMLKKK